MDFVVSLDRVAKDVKLFDGIFSFLKGQCRSTEEGLSTEELSCAKMIQQCLGKRTDPFMSDSGQPAKRLFVDAVAAICESNSAITWSTITQAAGSTATAIAVTNAQHARNDSGYASGEEPEAISPPHNVLEDAAEEKAYRLAFPEDTEPFPPFDPDVTDETHELSVACDTRDTHRIKCARRTSRALKGTYVPYYWFCYQPDEESDETCPYCIGVPASTPDKAFEQIFLGISSMGENLKEDLKAVEEATKLTSRPRRGVTVMDIPSTQLVGVAGRRVTDAMATDIQVMLGMQT